MPKEKPLSPSRRLAKSLPRPSPLMREAWASLFTDAQCEAWGRGARPAEVLKQADEWLTALDAALKKHDDVPCSRQRLGWVASLAVALEKAMKGEVDDAVLEARRVRDDALGTVKQLRARALSRMTVLVGGDAQRAAALDVVRTTKSSPPPALREVAALLSAWRQDGRGRLLADEATLDETFVAGLEAAAHALEDAEAMVAEPSPKARAVELPRLEGRLLRELHALHVACATARAEGLHAPVLKVRPALKATFA